MGLRVYGGENERVCSIVVCASEMGYAEWQNIYMAL